MRAERARLRYRKYEYIQYYVLTLKDTQQNEATDKWGSVLEPELIEIGKNEYRIDT